MTQAIINLQAWQVWLQTPPGQRLLAWEARVVDEAVADAFGYHALQLGMPMLDGLRCNRMPHRFSFNDAHASAVNGLCDFSALPFAAQSLDLVVLPHTLEWSHDPHTCLREVERVLVPEGRVVITGFNPLSLWGLAHQRSLWFERMGWGQPFLPPMSQMLAYRRLRDWLRLLGFEVEEAHFGLWEPALSSEQWLERSRFMGQLGRRWWPIFGAVYAVQAVKRVRGMRLLGPAWKTSRLMPVAPVQAARRLKPSGGHNAASKEHA